MRDLPARRPDRLLYQPPVPAMRTMLSLSSADAVAAIRLSHQGGRQ